MVFSPQESAKLVDFNESTVQSIAIRVVCDLHKTADCGIR